MENKRILKLIWLGSGTLLFINTVILYIKIFQSGQINEDNPARVLLEPTISGTAVLIVYGIIGIIYILSQKYKTFLKKIWMVFGILIYIFNLIPWLLLAYLFKSEITSRNSDVGGLAAAFFIGGWIQLGILILIGYAIVTAMYFIFKKMGWKTD
ncbi:hypothetical protein HYY70_00105 [Candidatus Woesearchaeota archaeon]|nr:hypothetical protein [Candidatus Woesearchaeota archaeon]